MLNLLLAGAVCVCCVLVGWSQRSRYRKRAYVMGELTSLITYIEEQIRFNMAPLPAIFADYASLYPTSAVGIACRAYPQIEDVALPNGEWETVRQLLLSLGHSDVAGQTGRLSYVKAQLAAMRDAADSEMHSKGNLYAKLWVLLGVGMMIWMV